jgi:hypothetical protein
MARRRDARGVNAPTNNVDRRRNSMAKHAVVAIAATAAVCSGCGSHSGAPSTPQASPSSSSPRSNATTTLDTAAYKLAVSTSSNSAAFTLEQSDQTAPPVQSYLMPRAPGVNVSLPAGAQPSAPVTLSFDFRGKPPPAGPGQLPAVVALSDGAPQPEVLASHWDPATQTLTATTDHFSSFFPFALDLGKLGDQITHMLGGYLGLSTGKPDCVGQPLTVDNTTYTLDPSTVPAAWPCLSRDGDAISVDLASNSPLAWVVKSQPATKDQTPDLQPDVAQFIDQAFYRTLFAGVVGDGTFLLPGGTTHLRFAKSTPPQQVGLRADPGATLLNGLALALHAMFPDSKIFDIPGVVGCFKPFTTSSWGGTDPTGADIGTDTRTLVDCVTSTTNVVSDKPTPTNPLQWATNLATKTLHAVLSLGPDIANQLAASVHGVIGEFTGENTETITVHASTQSSATAPAPSAPATLNLSTTGLEAGGGLMIGPNHFKFSPKSHDKQGYYVDLSYRWTINRPENSDLGYCKGHITVTDSAGATVYHEDDDNFNACEGGGAWGSLIKIRNAGTYTVTADIEMERGPALHGTVQFTVDPL